ncbi:RNA-binding protein 25-like isoform X2 [Mugil cephalus]|uniref:RNA-binding protein 25-like isoform X2 n=1 Tax=Mugil cephalus TaxID=48193 RepID=UPI001FB6AB5E|nr:RNA-binding protein 25-like isoform X2 [Mugil cephalus]
MSLVQVLRQRFNERLTAVAEEIFTVFEKTIVEYEEEISRQRKLLHMVLKPDVNTHSVELPQQHVSEEQILAHQQLCDQERNSSPDQADPEPPQIKEEPEEICVDPDREQIAMKEEPDIVMLTLSFEDQDHSEDQTLRLNHDDDHDDDGSVDSLPGHEDESPASQRRDLSTPRSRHPAQSSERDEILHHSRSSSGSRSRDRSRSRSRSRYRSRSRDLYRSRSRSRSRSGDIYRSRSRSGDIYRSRSRHTIRSGQDGSPDDQSRPEQSQDGGIPSPSCDRPRHVFQKRVLTMLTDIRSHLKTQPDNPAAHIKRIDTIEDFEREEERLCDPKAFDALVLQIARIGGKNTKDCVYKVLDRLFTNSLMAKFNMKGKGNKGKKPFENTKHYKAIQDGIMRADEAATEDFIRVHTSEHLKHAPQRCGGGGYKGVSQD